MFTLPSYDIESKLYEGGRSLVYRGTRKEDGQPVVLKLLKKEYPTADEIARFRLEYDLAKSLNSQGIIVPYDLTSYNNSPIIVMEDIGGQALQMLAKRPFPPNKFLPLALSIVNSLGWIHQAQIVHKDINPANIILNEETGQLKIIDFGIATQLQREEVAAEGVNRLEGTLRYISPEQTGRTNRAIDYRTDFYSLGATFYEILTGQPPFQVSDPLELVYCHLARRPVPPHELNTAVPSPISDIVMKLLAKNAEDRYQSAHGLHTDLARCWQEWQDNGTIEPFALGQQDVFGRFQIPQKLYGRSAELSTLLDAFSSSARATFLLVTGQAGIGKSSLIHEVHKPIAAQRGYFIGGKFDQFKRNIPYASLIQALQGLVRQLLSESPAQISVWRQKMNDALGNNGQVIAEIIPEVELLIGEQPPLQELSSAEAQNRFNLVFQNFIKLFAHPEHPLVLFLDDLQWADSATLDLLLHLFEDKAIRGLFVIGAYRDNELSTSHPLHLALAELEKTSLSIRRIALTDLNVAHVTELVANTLHCLPDEAATLAKLVHDKTGGNPFFVNQFLHSLYDEKLLAFDFESGRWQWEITAVNSLDITDNVVELMAGKLKKLPSATQGALKLAACAGNQFDLQIVADANQQSAVAMADYLWPALQEGLLFPIGDAYKFVTDDEGETAVYDVAYRFLHDRVQQAAYSLIADAEKPRLHLQIGQLMQQQTAEYEENLFDIANHLNQGSVLLKEPAERKELATINLQAGRKAKAAIAYRPARTYFKQGIDLLGADSWQTSYQLSFDLHVEWAECAYLTGDHETAEEGFALVLEQAHTVIEKAEITILQAALYTTRNKYRDALISCATGLKLLGIELPGPDDEVDIMPELGLLGQNLADRSIPDLANLPKMDNPEIELALSLLTRLAASAYFLNQNLFVLLVMRMVNLTLEHGNASYSAYAYAIYGTILTIALGQPQAGYEFGKLAFVIDEQFNNLHLRHRTHHNFGTFINHFHHHARESIPYLQKGYQYGVENGDLIYAGYCGNVIIYYLSLIGHPLDDVYTQSNAYLNFAQQAKDFETADNLIVSQQMILSLQGKTESPTSFQSAKYDEAEHVAHMQNIAMKLPLHWYAVLKMRSHFLFAEHTEALTMAELAEPLLPFAAGLPQMAAQFFYHTLTMAALYAEANEETQAVYLETMGQYQAQMAAWAALAPQNFAHKQLLMAAEMARISNEPLEAMALYDKAIDEASTADYLHLAALANELAAKFYLSQARTKVARVYLMDAHYYYLQWGAKAKTDQLERLYPNVFAPTRSSAGFSTDATVRMGTATISTTTTGSQSGTALDLASVLKATQAISGEIVLEKLLASLMEIVVENAGAQTGHLILQQQEEWLIEASSKDDQITLLKGRPLTSNALPLSIINLVRHTQEPVVIGDAVAQDQFINDEYIVTHQPKSILCMPLLHQSKLSGILYLENNLTTDTFTPERLTALNMLASQVVISLENARLYGQLTEYSRTLELKVDERTVELATATGEAQAARQAAESASEAKSAFLANMSHELRTPLNAVIGFTRIVKRKGKEVLPERQLGNLDKVQLSAEHLLALINTILDIAKIEAGRMDVQATTFSADTLVQMCATTAQPLLKRGVDLAFDVAADCPLIFSDQDKIKQVLLNLLSNAAKFTHAGTINVSATCQDDLLLVKITDTGIGMSEEAVGRIFEEFQQAESTTRQQYGGTGLGLPISRNLARLLGGELTAVSTPNEGSTFTLTIPTHYQAVD